ncbi:carotenoid biosynthesis protein [Halostella sp. JP-L12]|uniref:bisanhydrobacterioruberin hydratase n=1 Tax=Halostella TaxID=1843185 RepID=UPI000EF7CAC4|nr:MULTISPECIES: bisanhydrobacterioruberin hydratase [Halostella]NHN47169.1 carotenoid biosynthesis protein [Halostella sp. JP-L12]
MDRDALQRRLDDLVRENRFTIAVVFPAVGAALLLASAERLVPPPLAFEPTLILFGTLVMRLPLIVGVGPLLDRRAVAAILALAAYSYGIEFVGVRTGWPYGEFEYGIDLGPMLFGEVPVGLPVFFLPLVMNSYLLVALLFGPAARRRLVRLPATLATVLAVDLVLDPGAVALGFWSYGAGGAYYGVPASNYAGWVLSGAVAVVALDLAFDRTALLARLQSCEFALDDLVSFVVLWGGVNAVYGNWVPVLIAVGLFGGLLSTDEFDFDVVRAPGRWPGR